MASASLNAPRHPIGPNDQKRSQENEMNLKRTPFVVGALFLSAAFAAPSTAGTIVFEKPLQSEDLTAAHFDVNRQLGRAWIDVELTPKIIAEAPESARIPPRINGPYYRQPRKQRIYLTA